MTTHAEFAAGMRAIADFVENNPDTVGLPYDGTLSEFSIFADSRDEFLTWLSLLTGKKVTVKDEGKYGVQVTGAIHGFRVIVYGNPDFLDYKVVGTVEKREYDLAGLLDAVSA
jgi:hypothetical protein